MSQTDPSSYANDDSAKNWEEILKAVVGEQAAKSMFEAMQNSGMDIAAMASAAGIPQDPIALQIYIRQLQDMINNRENTAVNWEFAKTAAIAGVSKAGNAVVNAQSGEQCRLALATAQLWLDVATDFVPADGKREVWNRQTWVSRTMSTWKRMLEPVAEHTCQAMTALIDMQKNDMPAEIQTYAQKMAGLDGVAAKMIGAVYGQEMAVAITNLATEACTSTDIGFPLLEGADMALVPENIQQFAAGIDASYEEVLALWAVREAAHSRLYANVPWLRAKVLQLVEKYAQEVRIDPEQFEQEIRDIDLNDQASLGRLMQGGLYESMTSVAQKQAREDLETILALIEGWVEQVTWRAAAAHIAHLVPLGEMIRRRRVGGGPAERAFSTLVGLQLRPRRMRDAAKLWQLVEQAQGMQARDGLWAHPDILPTSSDIDNPDAFLARRALQQAQDEAVDQELAALLDGSIAAGPVEEDSD